MFNIFISIFDTQRLQYTTMKDITKGDFLYMVENQRLEVLTQAQLQCNTGAVRDFIQKALVSELTDIEKADANQLITDVAQFDCWCVLRDDFTKAVVYTRPAQVEWTDAEQGEFGEIVKAKAGVYRNTAENRKLGRVGQKYGEGQKPGLSSAQIREQRNIEAVEKVGGEKKEDKYDPDSEDSLETLKQRKGENDKEYAARLEKWGVDVDGDEKPVVDGWKFYIDPDTGAWVGDHIPQNKKK